MVQNKPFRFIMNRMSRGSLPDKHYPLSGIAEVTLALSFVSLSDYGKPLPLTLPQFFHPDLDSLKVEMSFLIRT